MKMKALKAASAGPKDPPSTLTGNFCLEMIVFFLCIRFYFACLTQKQLILPQVRGEFCQNLLILLVQTSGGRDLGILTLSCGGQLLSSSSSSSFLLVFQYLNRGCTRFFASKETDKQILQNRKSPEVRPLVLAILLSCCCRCFMFSSLQDDVCFTTFRLFFHVSVPLKATIRGENNRSGF